MTKLVVLDLDGVLITKQFLDGSRPPKDTADIVFTNCEIYIDKSAIDFVEYLAQNFKIGIWVSQPPNNVNEVIEIIFKGIPVEFIYYQKQCDVIGNKPIFIKHINKIHGFPKDQIMFIDDDDFKVSLNTPAAHINCQNIDNIMELVPLLMKWDVEGNNGDFDIEYDYNIAFDYYRRQYGDYVIFTILMVIIINLFSK